MGFALAVICLVVFGALVLEPARVSAERRRAQNAVDAAALAWAAADAQLHYGQIPSYGKIYAQGGIYSPQDVQNAIPAYTALAGSGYYNIPGRVLIEMASPAALDPDPCPPGSADARGPSPAPQRGCDQTFQVTLYVRPDRILPPAVYGGAENIIVQAAARVVPPQSISPGNALVAARRDACPGMIFNGGSAIQVTGGNIFSNSTASSDSALNGGNCSSAVATGGLVSIQVIEGNLLAAGEFRNDTGAAVSPRPAPYAAPQDLPDVPAPDCANLPPRSQGVSSAPLEPGVYTSITINAGDWTMNPGMYCLNGSFKVSGGSLRGKDVLIVMNAGSIDFSASAHITLKRPNEYVDGKRQHFPGMLIHMPASNPGGIVLSGNTGSYYAGTVYAPGPRDPRNQAKCSIGGSGQRIDIRGSVICSTVSVAGNAQVNFLYKEEENYRLPPRVELVP